MALKEFIQKSFERHYAGLMRVVDGLTPEELAWRPNVHSNSIGFLVWHYGRALDLWVQTQARGTKQLWETEWASAFDCPPDPQNLGFGYTTEQLEAFVLPETSVLLGYAEAMRANTIAYLNTLDDEQLEQMTIPHRSGDLITLATMFEMLLFEVNQHGGQAAYLRGMQRGLNQ